MQHLEEHHYCPFNLRPEMGAGPVLGCKRGKVAMEDGLDFLPSVPLGLDTIALVRMMLSLPVDAISLIKDDDWFQDPGKRGELVMSFPWYR